MPDRIADHYARHAHAFDHARQASFVEKPWLDRFRSALPRGGHVLDLGCGGGEPVGRYLIDYGFQLTGVDIAAPLIALARTRFGRHEWVQADMRAYAPERSFAGILAWDSLFHLPQDDQRTMLAKIAAWLEPAGALLFNSGPAAGEAIGCQFGEDLYHASLDPAEYRALFAAGGLAEIAYTSEDPRCGGRSVWLVRKLR